MKFPASAGLFIDPPGAPWSVRVARSMGSGPALEVYVGGSLVDVVLASSRGARLLRGACSAVVAGKPCTIAWGCLPVIGGPQPRPEFSRGWLFFSRTLPATADSIADRFWLAAAKGRFGRVAVDSHGTREWCRAWAAGKCLSAGDLRRAAAALPGAAAAHKCYELKRDSAMCSRPDVKRARSMSPI
jgi:hypothetical protein